VDRREGLGCCWVGGIATRVWRWVEQLCMCMCVYTARVSWDLLCWTWGGWGYVVWIRRCVDDWKERPYRFFQQN
jgi:hypothetical protein